MIELTDVTKRDGSTTAVMLAITCAGYGRPTDVLHLDEVPEPTISEDEVLVRVHAAALNPADWHLVRGVPYLARLSVGLRRPSFRIPGSDFAGVVEATGSPVTTVASGDEVYGTTFMAGFGAFAEKVVVPERLVARRPRNMSFAEAAAVPLAASAALQALRKHGKVEPGQHVLLIGSSGGVGTYAVQIAKHLGATVTAVCSAGNVAFVRSLGANHVIDYTTEGATGTAQRYDVVMQIAGTHPASQLRRVLEPTGTLVQLSGDSANRWVGPLPRIVAGRLRSRSKGQTVTSFTVKPDRDDLDLLTTLIEAGALRTHVERTWSIEDVGEALEQLQHGRTRGKAVVELMRAEAPADQPARVSAAARRGQPPE